MYYVYQLKSTRFPNQRYTGFTKNIDARLKAHNNGQIPHTAKFKPWKMINFFAFSNLEKAKKFETYLKSGSGRAFSKKHFW